MNDRYKDIRREPSEESEGLYPGLVVDDDRVGGSITVGASRLPLWAFLGCVIEDGWEEATSEDAWPCIEDYGLTQRNLSDFLHDLVQARGEFGRLVLMLADAERISQHSVNNAPAWWERDDLRARIKEQLQRCLDSLQD